MLGFLKIVRAILFVLVVAFSAYGQVVIGDTVWSFAILVIFAVLLVWVEALKDRRVIQRERAQERKRFDQEKRQLVKRERELDDRLGLLQDYKAISGLAIKLTGRISSLVAGLKQEIAHAEEHGSAGGKKNSIEKAKDSTRTVEDAVSELLRAVQQTVRGFYRTTKDLTISTSYMLAFPVSECPPVVRNRARFVGHGRKVESYTYLLDLRLWVPPESDVPSMALPVEDVDTNPSAVERSLAGAPMAFALRRDQVVCDTQEIREYSGKHIDPDVLKEQEIYFRQRPFKSFASLVLWSHGEPVGILNINSSHTDVFGESNYDEESIKILIAPLRHALGSLVVSQLQLEHLESQQVGR